MITPRYRVWDGQMMHNVVALVWEKYGFSWYGVVGKGYCELDPNFDDWDNIGGRPKRIDELMQWIGLKDNKGVRIYDGDLLKVVTHGDCWLDEETYTSIIEVRERRQFGESEGSGWLYIPEKREVVGNIHEHKDLLKNVD